MAKANFYLKDSKDDKKETLIYLFFSYNGKRLKYSTGEKIAPRNWKVDSQQVRRSYTGSVEINNHLRALEEKAFSLFRQYTSEGKKLSTAILRAELDDAFNRLPKDQLTFFDVYDEFVNTTKAKVHSRTTQKYLTLKNHLAAFQKKTRYPLDFDNINIRFFDKFLFYYMDELGLLNNTIGKYISTLKTFLNWATERDYNTKLDYIRFKAYKEEADIVFLEYTELMKLYELDLAQKPRLERVRDTFCLGCFTGLRFSDIKQLKPEDIKNDVIQIKSYKTKETLRVPLNQFAKAIIDKYLPYPDFLHVISNQKMNNYIKELCELAEINEPITLTKFRGVERIEITKPKFQLVSTHTARRTFVTLSLEQGMRPEIVMQITGHKSYKIFKKYIKITDKVKEVEMRQVWNKERGKGGNPFMRVS